MKEELQWNGLGWLLRLGYCGYFFLLVGKWRRSHKQSKIKNNIEDLSIRYENLERKFNNLPPNKKKELESEIETLRSHVKNLDLQAKDLVVEKRQLSFDIEKLEAMHTDLTQDCQNLQDEKRLLESEIERLQEKYKNLVDAVSVAIKEATGSRSGNLIIGNYWSTSAFGCLRARGIRENAKSISGQCGG